MIHERTHALQTLNQGRALLRRDVGIDEEMRAPIFAPLRAAPGRAAEGGEGRESKEEDQGGRDPHRGMVLPADRHRHDSRA